MSGFDGMKEETSIQRIQRITRMEEILDTATAMLNDLELKLEAYEQYQSEIKVLEEYYASQRWKDDFELDEKGGFPPDLKRGVLSEDGIYNLLERNREMMERIRESYELISDGPSKRIYEAVKQIPYGRVATYADIAELAGDRKMARAVGNALHKNPDPEHIPCFRVVNAKGELAGGFAFGGAEVQARMLEAEGVEVVDGVVDLKKYRWGE